MWPTWAAQLAHDGLSARIIHQAGVTSSHNGGGFLSSPSTAPESYFRRDQANGIAAPDLSKLCSFAEHIVKARGKRTQYTSVSLDLGKIGDFGEADYQLDRDKATAHSHIVVEHTPLLSELQRVANSETKEEKLRAVQALRYSRKCKEGLVQWVFDTSSVARKDLITWAYHRVQQYFAKV